MPKELIKTLPEIRYLAQVLSKDVRLNILELLIERDLNVKEIADILQIPISTATVNIQKLEDVDLITSEAIPGIRGTQKICSLKYDEIRLKIRINSDQHNSKVKNNLLPDATSNQDSHPIEKIIALTMPVGHFVDCHIHPYCGMVSDKHLIGKMDEIPSFYLPEKVDAQLVWVGQNSWLEYHFPFSVPLHARITSLLFSCEICSEAKNFQNDYPSDITLWINNQEIATWVSPGDFGGSRGKFTPKWWPKINTQFGVLTMWEISSDGTTVNDVFISSFSISNLNLEDLPYLSVKIGVKDTATNRHGFNLFGAKFGNYTQDLQLKIHYFEK